MSPASSHPRAVAILLERIIVANHSFGHPEHSNTNPDSEIANVAAHGFLPRLGECRALTANTASLVGCIALVARIHRPQTSPAPLQFGGLVASTPK